MGTHTSNTGPHQGPGGISGGARPADMAREETRRRQEHKKQLKRAANRKSAQLSRQRKKQYVEELTKEHSELKVRRGRSVVCARASPQVQRDL